MFFAFYRRSVVRWLLVAVLCLAVPPSISGAPQKVEDYKDAGVQYDEYPVSELCIINVLSWLVTMIFTDTKKPY